MNGRRIPDDEWLARQGGENGGLELGDYGFQTLGGRRELFFMSPAGDVGRAALHDDDRKGERHTVVEHEDGTVTVDPSIHFAFPNQSGWHGYLERGVWREA